VLISAPFLHMIPKAFTLNPDSPAFLLAGFFGMHLFNRFFTAFVAASATTPLGMLVSWPMVSVIDEPTLGLLLSVSAGALVYVGATHLLPRAEQEQRRYSLVALAGGVLVAVVIVLSKG
jgi:zinc transporter ZupT